MVHNRGKHIAQVGQTISSTLSSTLSSALSSNIKYTIKYIIKCIIKYIIKYTIKQYQLNYQHNNQYYNPDFNIKNQRYLENTCNFYIISVISQSTCLSILQSIKQSCILSTLCQEQCKHPIFI